MTLESAPNQWESVNSDLVYVVSSTHSSEADHQYIADIYINSIMVFRAKEYPNEDGLGVFNLGSVLRQYVTAAFKSEQGYGEFKIMPSVKFGEEYGGTAYTDLITETTSYGNFYLSRFVEDLSVYNDVPATTREKTVKIVKGSSTYYVPYFAVSSSPFSTTINGTTASITPSEANTMQRVNIAASAAASNYTAVINGTTFNVELVCAGYFKTYYVHFLNQYGGWESMLFNKQNKRRFNVERKSYQQQPFRVSSAGDVSIKTGNVYHQQRTTFGTLWEEKISIATDWVSDTDYKWLRQLVCSPFIYLEDEGNLYPCQIENSNYEEKQYNADGLTQLQLDISFGVKHNTQFS